MKIETELELLYENAKSEGGKLAGFSNPANIKETLNRLVEIAKEIDEKEKLLIDLINRE